MILFILLTGSALFSFGQTCKIGDILINRNDRSRGVVFWVNPERTGGWMVAMKNMPKVPLAAIEPSDNLPVPLYVSAKDTAGYSNTLKLRSMCKPGDYNILQVDIEHGWYIPACGQLWHLLSVRDIVDPILTAYGGDIMSDDYMDLSTILISSSPGRNYNYIYDLDFSFKTSKANLLLRGTDRFSQRAVRTFAMSDILIDTTLTYQWNTGDKTPQISDKPATTTTYRVKATTTDGCPAEASGQVFVTNTPQIEIYDTIRRGEIYTKHGFGESEPGTYPKTVDNGNGCSTEIILHLYVQEPLSPTIFNETICEGQIYTQHNFTVWENGSYTQQWTSADGRDSTVILNLTVHPVYNQTFEATICQGERYTQNGFDKNEAGTYVQHFTTQQGCDSTIILTLNVLPNYLFTEEQTLCYGETYEFRGKTISESGIYYDSLKTVTGCDSVYMLTLNIKPEITKNIQATICQGERYTQNGFDQDKAGTYVQHFTTQQGCDSTVTLILSVLPHYLFTEEQTLCYGETYEFRGRTLNQSGIYYDSLKTVTGCDSVYMLTLNIKPEITKNIQATICQGERYTQNGFDKNEAGTYVQHFISQQGCDSTVTLILSVTTPPEGKIQAELKDCASHTYFFRFIPNGADHLSDYFWDFGNGEISDEISPRYSFADSGQYTIRLTLHPEQLCNTTFTYALNVPYYPENLSIYTDPAFVSKEYPEIILWTDPIPGISYRWELGDGNTATGDRISHFYDFSSMDAYPIRLTATNSENCITEQNALLPNKQVFVIPNTFSPNGDGINDVFMPGYRMKIMDRNSLVVYKGNEGWDGNYKGAKASEDVYFYVLYLKTDRSSKEITGYIHLSR